MGWIWLGLGLYGLLAGGLFFMQRSLLYFPSQEKPDPSDYAMPGLRVITTNTEDGLTLSHWFKPPAQAEGPVIVVWHGNAGNIGGRVEKLRGLVNAGFGLLLAEYRGYGGNPGKPTETGLLVDARSVLAWLADQGIGTRRTLLYGESLGTGVAVKMAAAQAEGEIAGPFRGTAVAGLILEAPYTSIAAVAQSHYWYLPARWALLDKWDSAAVIGKIATPLLVIHGREDATVPFRFGERLFDLAPMPKESLFLPDAGHNDLYNWPEVTARVIDFVERQMSEASR